MIFLWSRAAGDFAITTHLCLQSGDSGVDHCYVHLTSAEVYTYEQVDYSKTHIEHDEIGNGCTRYEYVYALKHPKFSNW